MEWRQDRGCEQDCKIRRLAMMTKKQIDKFKAAAKEAGAEMSDAKFKKVVGKLAKAPKPKKPAGERKKN